MGKIFVYYDGKTRDNVIDNPNYKALKPLMDLENKDINIYSDCNITIKFTKDVTSVFVDTNDLRMVFTVFLWCDYVTYRIKQITDFINQFVNLD